MTPEEFKTWRKKQGWTQQEAAHQLGISRLQVVRYENTTKNGTPVTAISRPVYLATVALTAFRELLELPAETNK